MNIDRLKYSHLINKSIFPNEPVIIDGGACVGNFSKSLLEEYKNSKMFLIEPCKSNFNILKEKFKDEKNIFIYDKALTGDMTEKSVEFSEFIGLEEWGNAKNLYSNISPKPTNLKEIIKYNVETINIEKIVKAIIDLGHETIDYMKLDVEGYEQEIVRTMYTSNINNIRQISMEIHCNVDRFYIEDQLNGIGYKTVIYSEGELYGCFDKI